MGWDERKAVELNEVGWWSGWGKVLWLGTGCYVLQSQDFDESFFNRAGFLSCDASSDQLRKVEAAFRSNGRDSHVMVFESCTRSVSSLKKRGYAAVDGMTVLKMGEPAFHASDAVQVRRVGFRDLDAWCEAYLLSFYGDLDLKPRVMRLARRFAKSDSVTLLIAELDGKVAGVTALYRSPLLLGLYCLGTLPNLRRRGVAGALLSSAQTIAAAEGRKFVLQSLLSEGAGSYYLKVGFERLYVKELLRKPAMTEGQVADEPRAVSLGIAVKRDAGTGPHLFTGVFQGFEEVEAVRKIFGQATKDVLSELLVEVVDERGYMHVNAVKGSIAVSGGYLKEGNEKYLYLDAIHELVHVRQHLEGKELWDRSYKYVDRPTELEAYRVAVDEARRIGFTDGQLVDYLKVEWVSDDDFRKFLVTLGVKAGKQGPA